MSENNNNDDVIARNVAKWRADREKKANQKTRVTVKKHGLAFDAIQDALNDAIQKSKGD